MSLPASATIPAVPAWRKPGMFLRGRLTTTRSVAYLLSAAVGYLFALYSSQLVQVIEVHSPAFAEGSTAALLRKLYLPPTKTTWVLTWLSVSMVSLPLTWVWSHRYLAPRWDRLSQRGRWIIAGTATLWAGIFLLWWDFGLCDNRWVFAANLRTMIGILGVGCGWLLTASLAWSLLALTIDPHAMDVPSEPQAPWFDWTGTFCGWGLFAIVAAVFGTWYVASEQAIYVWDYGFYWQWSATQAVHLGSDPALVVEEFQKSVKYGSYNLIPAMLPAAVMSQFGTDRVVYILGVLLPYGLAVAMTLSLAVRGVGRHWVAKPNAVATLVPFAVLLGMPMLWAGTMRGLPGVGGVAIALGILAIYLSRPWNDLRWPQWLAIAAMLALLSLFRRWYNFWVLAFLAVVALESLMGLVRLWYRDGLGQALSRAVSIAAVPLVFVAILSSLSWPMVKSMATVNLADQYLGYKLPQEYGVRLGYIAETIGWAPLLVAALGGMVLLFDTRTIRAVLVPVVMIPVMLYEFLKVQDPSVHHYGLFMPTLLLLAAAGLTRILVVVPGIIGGVGLFFVLIAAELPPAAMYAPFANRLRVQTQPWLPAQDYYPWVRTDTEELKRLLQDVDRLTRPNKTFAVVSSSMTLNFTTFRFGPASLKLALDFDDRLIELPEVDRRDGYPRRLFDADYLIVADPPQLHLRPEEQQVIAIPANCLLSGTAIGAAYTPLNGRYNLERGVSVRIFHKDRDPSPEETDAFQSMLHAAHPDCPKVWRE